MVVSTSFRFDYKLELETSNFFILNIILSIDCYVSTVLSPYWGNSFIHFVDEIMHI